MREITETIKEVRDYLENGYIEQGYIEDAVLTIVNHKAEDIFWLLEKITYDMVSFISGMARELDLDAEELRSNRRLSKSASDLANRLSLTNEASFEIVMRDASFFRRQLQRYSQSSKVQNNQNIIIVTNIIQTIMMVLEYLEDDAGFVIAFPQIEELTLNSLRDVIIPFVSAVEEIDSLTNEIPNEKRNLQISEISTHSPLQLIVENFGVLSPILLVILYLSSPGREYIGQKIDQLRANNMKIKAEAQKLLAEARKTEAETRAIELNQRGYIALAELYARVVEQPEKSELLIGAFERLTRQEFNIHPAKPEKPSKPLTLPKQ
jgi:hypothetical protein